MADSTTWTLEFVDHDGNDIVLIPGVTELAASYYYHLHDGGFSAPSPKKKRLWAGDGNIDRRGASLIHEEYDNRKITIDLSIHATDRNYVIAALEGLYRFANEVGFYSSNPSFRLGYWYLRQQWLGTLDTEFSYLLLLACDVTVNDGFYGEGGINFYDGSKYIVPVQLTITAEPAWRDLAPFSSSGTVIVNQSSTALGVYVDDGLSGPYIEIDGADIDGDVPPLLNIIAWGRDVVSTNHPTKLYLALKSSGIDGDFYSRRGVQDGAVYNGADKTYLATATGPGGANLVSNEFFITLDAGADVFEDWTDILGNGSIAQSATVKYRSRWSALLTSGSDVGTSTTQEIAVSAATDYTFGAFCYTPAGNLPLRYRIYDVTNAADIVATSALDDEDDQWRGTLDRFTTPSGCVLVRIYIISPNLDGDLGYADYITLGESNSIEISPTAAADAKRCGVSWTTGISADTTYFAGSYRVRIRARLRSGVTSVEDVGVRATWASSAYRELDVGDGRLHYLKSVNVWQLIDLGDFVYLPNPLAGGEVLSVNLYTEHDTTADFMDVDYIELVPVDEGNGWVVCGEELNSGSGVVIDQSVPGRQDVWFGNSTTYYATIYDYDLQMMLLVPGRTYRLYVNAETASGLSDANMYIYADVSVTNQRMMVE